MFVCLIRCKDKPKLVIYVHLIDIFKNIFLFFFPIIISIFFYLKKKGGKILSYRLFIKLVLSNQINYSPDEVYVQ